MARLTGLTAMGLTGRKRSFTGTPAVVEPKPPEVSRGGGGFLDIPTRTEHIERIRILLLDELLVTTRERIESPPQIYVEPIRIILEDQILIITREVFKDGESFRRGRRMAFRWLGFPDTKDDIDPHGILGD